MLQIQDYQDLLLQNHKPISKQHLHDTLHDIFDLIEKSTRLMEQEYKAGEYGHNFKQTLKHLINTQYHYTTSELKLKKDMIIHYRDMLQVDMMILTQHMSDLLSHDILDAELLRSYQHNITDIQKDIAHFAAVIKSLKELISE